MADNFSPGALFSHIYIERQLVIENGRLGALRAFLLSGATALLIYNLLFSQPWFRAFEPSGNGLELWATRGAAARSDSDFCSNESMQDYQFDYDGWLYSPSRCAQLPPGEDYRKVGHTLFFPTYANDNYFTRVTGEAQCIELRETCASMPGRAFSELGEYTCECTSIEEFIVSAVEEHTVWLNHGYSVPMQQAGQYGTSSWQQGRSTNSRDMRITFTEGEGTTEEEINTNILTIIKRPDGTECSVGGKSRWQAEAGIHGTLAEWLACASRSLDDTAPELRANSLQADSPHLRITGMKLELSLSYSNYNFMNEIDHNGVMCSLTVRAVPVWNSFTDISYNQVPRTAFEGGAALGRYRYAYGLSVELIVDGSFGFLDYSLFFTALMANAVLISLPHQILAITALYLVGLTSKVYRRARNKKFRLNDEFHGFCARLMGHAQTFQDMSNLHQRGKKLKLTDQDLEQHMLATFMPDGSEPFGDFTVKEVQKMVHALICLADEDADGFIDMREYCFAAASNECIDLHDAVQIFDSQRRISIVEGLLGDKSLIAATKSDFLKDRADKLSLPALAEVNHETEDPEDSMGRTAIIQLVEDEVKSAMAHLQEELKNEIRRNAALTDLQRKLQAQEGPVEGLKDWPAGRRKPRSRDRSPGAGGGVTGKSQAGPGQDRRAQSEEPARNLILDRRRIICGPVDSSRRAANKITKWSQADVSPPVLALKSPDFCVPPSPASTERSLMVPDASAERGSSVVVPVPWNGTRFLPPDPQAEGDKWLARGCNEDFNI